MNYYTTCIRAFFRLSVHFAYIIQIMFPNYIFTAVVVVHYTERALNIGTFPYLFTSFNRVVVSWENALSLVNFSGELTKSKFAEKYSYSPCIDHQFSTKRNIDWDIKITPRCRCR